MSREILEHWDFDRPFTITEDGAVEAATGLYAPEVYNDESADVRIYGDGWTALTGHTGQYGYHGAVMHPSEFVGGGLADYLLDNPGTYVLVIVECDDEDGEDSEPAGWAILRHEDAS